MKNHHVHSGLSVVVGDRVRTRGTQGCEATGPRSCEYLFLCVACPGTLFFGEGGTVTGHSMCECRILDDPWSK